jgi:hypothetical protein
MTETGKRKPTTIIEVQEAQLRALVQQRRREVGGEEEEGITWEVRLRPERTAGCVSDRSPL